MENENLFQKETVDTEEISTKVENQIEENDNEKEKQQNRNFIL